MHLTTLPRSVALLGRWHTFGTGMLLIFGGR
jgi:hypothetical protein